VALEPGTGSDALCFAAQFSECGEHARALHERCLDYVAKNFADCSRALAFAKLPCETVHKLIARDDLNVKEDVVLVAARAWFDHDTDGRKGSLNELAQLIRWPLLPVTVQLELKGDPLLMNAPQQLVIELLTECFGSFKKSDGAAGCLRLKPRKGSESTFKFQENTYRGKWPSVGDELVVKRIVDERSHIARNLFLPGTVVVGDVVTLEEVDDSAVPFLVRVRRSGEEVWSEPTAYFSLVG
jgi:hypothetical protein